MLIILDLNGSCREDLKSEFLVVGNDLTRFSGIQYGLRRDR